jgi:hypothetical protein
VNAVRLPAIAELPASWRAATATAGTTRTASATAEASAAESATTAAAAKSTRRSTATPETGNILRLGSKFIASAAEKSLSGTGIGLRVRR